MDYEVPALYQNVPVIDVVAHYGNKCNGPCRDSSPPQATTSTSGAYEVDE
jgi:hypothetical protein